MKVKVALAVAALALAASPAALAIGKPAGTPNGNGGPEGAGVNYTPAEEGHHGKGPKGGMPDKAKAYGRTCQGESKKHVDGEQGTPFSRCVKNMAQAAHHKGMAPGRVCKGESKKHVKGEKGTPFSRCVHNVVKLRQEERKKEHEEKHNS